MTSSTEPCPGTVDIAASESDLCGWRPATDARVVRSRRENPRYGRARLLCAARSARSHRANPDMSDRTKAASKRATAPTIKARPGRGCSTPLPMPTCNPAARSSVTLNPDDPHGPSSLSRDDGIGRLPEIVNGNPPFAPGGCGARRGRWPRWRWNTWRRRSWRFSLAQGPLQWPMTPYRRRFRAHHSVSGASQPVPSSRILIAPTTAHDCASKYS